MLNEDMGKSSRDRDTGCIIALIVLVVFVLVSVVMYALWLYEWLDHKGKIICIKARVVSIDSANDKVCVFNADEFADAVVFVYYDARYENFISVGDDLLLLPDDNRVGWKIVGALD